MEIQIKNYEFKVASLDLVGVYAYQDYMKDKQLNILTEFQKDGKLLKEIADQYFKEFIIIQGTQRRIRAYIYGNNRGASKGNRKEAGKREFSLPERRSR
jgi:hypothetical protein